jgi:hypothetical protein
VGGNEEISCDKEPQTRGGGWADLELSGHLASTALPPRAPLQGKMQPEDLNGKAAIITTFQRHTCISRALLRKYTFLEIQRKREKHETLPL